MVGVRLPLTIATAVVLLVGVVVGVAALGSARAGGAAPLDPITVQAPVGPAPVGPQLPGQQSPPDPQGYVAPPPPVRDDGDDGGFRTGDDGPGDDGPDDDGPDGDD
jgi:hypothetical protein